MIRSTHPQNSSARTRGPLLLGAGAGACGFVNRRSTSFTSTVVRLPFLIAAAAAGAAERPRARGRRQHRRRNDDETDQWHTGGEHDEALSSWPSAVLAGRV